MDRLKQAYMDYVEAWKNHRKKQSEYSDVQPLGSPEPFDEYHGPVPVTEAAAAELLKLSREAQQKYEAYLDLLRSE